MTTPIAALLVEDNRDYSEALALAFEGSARVRLARRFATAEIALRHLHEIQLEIILLDLALPGMSGVEAIPHFRRKAPQARIVMLTQSDAEKDVIRSISLGAAGYLLKSSPIGVIIEAIEFVAKGGASLDPKVARYILENLSQRLPNDSVKVDLSERETEVLYMIGEGLVKKQIADRLRISYTTVDSHVRHIYEKLQVTNAPAAVSQAYKLGIFLPRKPPPSSL